jgi:phosphatidylinositol-3-phosphatase
MRHLAATIAMAPLFALGCANNSGSTDVQCQALTPPATPTAAPSQFGGTIFTIVMENHSRSEILGNSSAPFINQLASQYTVAAGYHDSYVHPSEPNYIWMLAGENFGILDDDDPNAHHLTSTSHLADQMEQAGITWKAYEEGMDNPCGLHSSGRYAAKHNPFAYFNDINGWDGSKFNPDQRCNEHVVDFSQFSTDLANHAMSRYVFITPNLDNDMHDGSIAQGDGWLKDTITKIMADDSYKNGGTIFLMWDEGGGSPANDDPPFLVISENAKKGYTSQTDYDTSSYLKSVQAMIGVSALPCDPNATGVEAMNDLFTIPVTTTP